MFSKFRIGVGLIYLMAFVSVALQITGLVGETGILPIELVKRVAFHGSVTQAMSESPSLFWIFSSNSALNTAAYGGVLASFLMVVGVFPCLMAGITWVLYASFVGVGADFFQFQWDILLLEFGLISFFILMAKRMTRWGQIAIGALLFRVIWMSGVVKLLSGDWQWWAGTALEYHFLTQPLPHIGGFLFHHLPAFILFLMTMGVLGLELVLPFLLFFKRSRLIALLGIILLMVMIGLTGNYGYFNWLVLVMVVGLWDPPVSDPPPAPSQEGSLYWVATVGLVTMLVLGGLYDLGRFYPGLSSRLKLDTLGQCHVAGRYGLFAVMTTERNELRVEGSRDGDTWYPYEFRFKPNSTIDFPYWTVFHMPRLDWQMWFAALSQFDQQGWLHYFIDGLFREKPGVLSLIDKNPFTSGAPEFIRVSVDRYEFSSINHYIKTHEIWVITPIGDYSPILIRPNL